MASLDQILDRPSYGFTRDGVFYRPTRNEIVREFFSRLNIFKSRRNWLPAFGWFMSLSLAFPLYLFLTRYFSWPLFLAGFIYSMVLMGSHGTVWLHRYSTHRAFQFKNRLARAVCRNLVIKVIPEEIYVISHHVHHRMTEKPGDPYNVHGGWLYCFLADATHQMINKDLNEKDYKQVCKLVEHTGMSVNSYAAYKKWGTLCKPLNTLVHYALNWGFWFAAFYLIGGMPLAIAIFGMAGIWAIGVRTYNYDGHGRGVDRRRDGVDFYRGDMSVNQVWPGYVAGEWHNNHHLFPRSARSGFMSYQLDLPWIFIRTWKALGLVSNYRDNKADFLRDYFPATQKQQEPVAVGVTVVAPVIASETVAVKLTSSS